MLGVRLHQGTINVELSQEAFAKLYHHPWLVVPGSDQIDIDDNQNIGLIPCHVEGVLGVRVIPSNRQKGSLRPSTIEMCSSLRKLFRRLVMADIEGIDAQQAHTKAKSNQALLVCAYENEAKCRRLNLDGSISFTSFKSRVNSLPKSQEIIFY